MNGFKIIKAGLGLITSLGVGAIVGNLINSTTPDTVKTIMKGCIWAGGMVLSTMVGDMVAKYTVDQIDDAVDMIKEITKTKPEKPDIHEV